MAQKLYRSPSQRPIQEPSGAANGLTHYSNLRRWVEQSEADKGEVLIYEDFGMGFNCVQKKSSDETKTAGNSLTLADWKVMAIGAHTEDGDVSITNVNAAGRLVLNTNDSDNDYLNLAYSNDICRPDRPWSFECELALEDESGQDLSIGVAADVVLLSDVGTAANGAYFHRAATGAISCISSIATADTTTLTTVTPVDATFKTYGIDFDGVGTAKFYLDGTLVATHTSFVSAQPTRPILEIKNAEGASNYAYLNHIAFYQSM